MSRAKESRSELYRVTRVCALDGVAVRLPVETSSDVAEQVEPCSEAYKELIVLPNVVAARSAANDQRRALVRAAICGL